MKKAQLLIGLLIAVWLVGCGSTVVPLEPVDLSEMTGYSTNRHTVAAQVEIKKADVLIEALKLEFERQKIINKKEPMPQIRNKDELIIWLMQKSNDNIKEVALAFATGGASPYAAFIPEWKDLPKGALAEFVESLGTAVSQALRTPAGTITATGYAAGQFFGGYDTGRRQAYSSVEGDINVNHTESTTSSAIGDGSSDNIITGQENCAGGACGDEAEVEEGGGGGTGEGCGEGSFYGDGTWWAEPGCSCDSRSLGHC